jgi:hypothetical protein
MGAAAWPAALPAQQIGIAKGSVAAMVESWLK